jgi:uncharacterized protein YlaI
MGDIGVMVCMECKQEYEIEKLTALLLPNRQIWGYMCDNCYTEMVVDATGG